MTLRARPRIDRVFPGKAASPPDKGTLNLADLDPPVWRILSRDVAHGPFTLGQLQAFVDAGKIGPLSRISAGHAEPFLPALDHVPLRPRLEAALEARAARRADASNFVIISGQGEATSLPVRMMLGGFGRFAEPMPGIFVLRARHTLADLRRALTAAVPEGAELVVLESRDARIGWAGLSADAAGALQAVWEAPVNPPAD